MSLIYYWIQPGKEAPDFDFTSTGYTLQNPLKLEPNISAICRGIIDSAIVHINMLFRHNSCIYFVNPEGEITSFLIYNTSRF